MTLSAFLSKWLHDPRLSRRSWWNDFLALEKMAPSLFELQIDAGLDAIANDEEAATLFSSLDSLLKWEAIRIAAAGMWQKNKSRYSFEEKPGTTGQGRFLTFEHPL